MTTAASKTMTPADHDALMDRVNREHAPAWRPNTSDKLVGRPVGVRFSDEGEYGKYPILTFRLADGTYLNWHVFHGIAREAIKDRSDALAKAIAANGGDKDWFAVYLGEHITNDTKDKPEKDQTTYHLYHVEIDGEAKAAAAGFDFSEL